MASPKLKNLYFSSTATLYAFKIFSLPASAETNISKVLSGKWKFVMTLNLPAGHEGPSPHTIELKETDSLLNYMKRTGGTITYTFENSDGEVHHWYTIPKNDSTNNTGYPLLCVQFLTTNYPGEKYAYEIEEGYLKMHNIAFKNADIYVYRRIR